MFLALVLVWLAVVTAGCGKPQPSTPPEPTGTPAFTPSGLRTPPVLPAAKAGLPDEASVVGVVVDGKARAYAIQALSSPAQHVINDLVSERPVSVTFCDKTSCAKVYAGKKPGEPLDLTVGGFYRDGLLLRYQTGMYRQETGESMQPNAPGLPFEAYPFERTTWKAWKQKHPDTEVFTGAAKENR